MNLTPQLLDIIACPKCKGKLVLNSAGAALHCCACALAYPVRDEIPVLLIDEATPLTAQP